MANKEPKLGELELQVLKVIWDRQPCTVQEVAELLGSQHGYARTTILTIMQRLNTKRFLKRRKKDGIYHYEATQEQGTLISALIEQFVGKVLDNSPLPLVAYLADSKQLSPEQVKELRKIVHDLESQSQETR